MKMIETPETISRWARTTFGEASVLSIAARMNVEMAELLEAVIEQHEPVKVAEECVDVLIMLRQILHVIAPGVMVELPNNYSGLALDSAAVIANKRVSALINALSNQSDPEIVCELIFKSMRVVTRLFNRVSPMIHVEGMIAAKMEINRARKWERTATGQIQHVDSNS